MAGPWEKYAKPAENGPWTKYAAPNRPAGLPDGVDLPQLAAHPAVSMVEPQPTFGEQVGGRLKSNAAGLVTPLLHPIKSMLSHPGFANPGDSGDVISDLRENPNKTGVANALGDTITAAALGAGAHFAPKIGAPIAEGLKRAGGELVDRTVGLHMKDVRHGAMPGRAYLEGGGTPALTMDGIAEKASNVKGNAGTQLRTAYDDASKAGVRIPELDVLNEVSEPIAKLRALKTSAGGTGITPEMDAFENSLLPPIQQASQRGGFTPSELFDQVKRPISENTRWNDPTMYDLNKVRQQTVGRIGGMLTDAVPETARLNKIYQGSGNLAERAKMRAETGQSPLSMIGRRGIEAAIGAGLGSEFHNPLLAAIPLVADSVPVRTGLGYSLFQGGRALPSAAAGLKSIAPLTAIARPSRPKPRPQDDTDR